MLIYLFYQVTISLAGGVVLTGYSEASGTEGERELSAWSNRNLPWRFLILCIQRQAAVCVLLGFFRLGVLAFEIGKRHVQRFVSGTIWVGALA